MDYRWQHVIQFYNVLDSVELGMLKSAAENIIYLSIKSGKVYRQKIKSIQFPHMIVDTKLDLYFAIKQLDIDLALYLVMKIESLLPFMAYKNWSRLWIC